ncbi:MAG: TonB-dependent receptor [Bacteroidota bacterium]|nr:TonB-dependent receptor [Bacteroidota bacterium]
MRRITIILIVLVAVTLQIFAQQYGILKGRVISKETNQPLPSANLMIKGTLIGAATDFNGNYTIPKIRPGKYILVVSLIGYRREEIINVVIESGKETILNIDLEPTAIQFGQIVITAGKREQTFADVPASVSIIDPHTLQRRNTVTIDDALRHVGGINLIESQISIRGSSGYSKGVGSRTLMLVDGIPLITGDTGEPIFESIPTNFVERIEILKGANSALYGSGAMGGVINVLTKEIPDIPTSYIRLYGGFYDKPYYPEWQWSSKTQFINGFYLSHSRKFADLKTLLAVNRTEDDGYRKNSRWQRWNFYLKSQYKFTPSKNLMLAVSYLDQRRNNFLYWKNLDSASVPPDDQLGDRVISKRLAVSTLFKNTVTDKLVYSIKGIWFNTDWRDDLEFVRNYSISNFAGVELQFNYQPHIQHILTSGIEINFNIVNSNIFGERWGYNFASYIQDEYKFSDEIKFTLGSRFDVSKLESLKTRYQVNPKLGVSYTPMPLTSFRFSAGRAFRSPTVGEAFTSTTASGITVIPNLNLKPEKSWSFEFGVNQILYENILLDVSVFHSEYQNLIEAKQVPASVGQLIAAKFINITRARIQGLEISTQTSWMGEKFIINFSYTFLNPKDLSKNDYLMFRPQHIVYSSFSFILYPFELGLDFRYLSKIKRIDDDLVRLLELAGSKDLDKRVPTNVLDLHLSYGLNFWNAPLRLSLHINNLLQYNYVELIGNIAPIRNYMLRIETSL